jgi:hypothetical protein
MNHEPGVLRGVKFVRRHALWILLISALLVVPCVWQPHIEAGDLGSHLYNAWLAQLISKGQAPGLYLAPQWHNVLFDWLLLHAANLAGFAAAEKIVVAFAVLIFFWGVFALVDAMTGQAPWFLTPCMAMLAYGYSFNMGFMNYYLSIGLACWGVAVFLGKGRGDRATALAILSIVLAAHPIGFLFALGAMAYFTSRNILPGFWKLAVPITAMAGVCALHWMLASRVNWEIDWTKDAPFYALNGSDQLVLYGDQYSSLARLAVLFGVICVLTDGIVRRRERWASWKPWVLPVELYLVAFVVTALLPENLRTSPEHAWIGLLVSRLTAISAIFGLSVLGCLKPRKWQLAGFVLLAAVFFVFLHDDMAYLNQVERSADAALWRLPYGTRVLPKLSAMPDSRIEFVGHLADRACIGHCFTYLNYEPPSQQFRVRANSGSPLAKDSYAAYEDMMRGTHVWQASDLPLTLLYECDGTELTRLCLRPLAAGEITEAVILKEQTAATAPLNTRP